MAETLRILLGHSNHTYKAGQILSGNVECVFPSNKKLRAIRVQVEGTAVTEWNVTFIPMIEKKYFTKETHLNYNCNLVEGNGTDILIPAGTHIYPFSCRLSSKLPSSFEGRYGNICYKIKVRLRPDDGNEVILPFHVISPIDLNAFPKLKEPFHYRAKGNMTFCYYNSGPMAIGISLPYTGYASGQKINIHTCIKNGSNINVEHVEFKLLRTIRYKTLHPSISRRYSQDVIATCTENTILAHAERSWTSVLDFSSIEVLNLMASKIMDVIYQLQVDITETKKYQLQIQVVLPFPYTDLNINCPIMLGTIPLTDVNQDLPEESVVINPYSSPSTAESFPLVETSSTVSLISRGNQSFPEESVVINSYSPRPAAESFPHVATTSTIPPREINRDFPVEQLLINSYPPPPTVEGFPHVETTNTNLGRDNFFSFRALSVPHLETSDLPSYEEAMNMKKPG